MPSIEPIPPLPPGLTDAVNNGRLVVFVGAGASRLLGCAGWDELARDLISACHDAEYINFKEKEALLREPDHRKSISICFHIISEKNNNPDLFYHHLERALRLDGEKAKQYPIYDKLHKLGAIFITTNADDHFDKLFIERAIIYRAEDFPTNKLDPTKLYHLHGTIRDKSSLVFRVDEYMRHYHTNQVRGFLEKLFSEYTILFVGYSLSEFQLLEYLIIGNGKADSLANTTKEARHFYLVPRYKGEENLLEFEQAYFSNLDIQVIGFDITARGHAQLYEVINAWQTEISSTTRALANTVEFIEQAAAGYEEENVDRVLQLIRDDKAIQLHFFKKVSDPRWLVPLRDAGYFDPSRNPPPNPVRDNPGFVTLSYWDVLRFLEKAPTRIHPDDENSFQLLLKIVRDIADYRDTEGQRIQNHNTDWAITKIFSTVPVRFLEANDIDRVHRFIESQWRTPVDSELGISLLPHLLRSGNKELVAKLYSVMLSYRWDTRAGSEEAVPLVDEFWLGESSQKHSQAINELIPVEAAQCTIRVMREILGRDTDAFHFISFRSIEALGRADRPDRFEGILIAALRDALLSEQQDGAVIRYLLGDTNNIFRRLALYAIQKRWEALQCVFWESASRDLLDDALIANELRGIVRDHFASFSEEQKRQWVEWIDTAQYWLPDDVKDDPEKREKYLARRKLLHLLVIRGKGYTPADQLHRKYVEVIGEEITEEPDIEISGWLPVGSETQDLAGRLLKMSVPEIVQFLSQQPPGQHLWETSIASDALQQAVEVGPEKFATTIDAFASVTSDYLDSLVRGLMEAWKAGKTFNWEHVLAFFTKLLELGTFWTTGYHPQLVKDISDLITAGTQSDQRSFTQELLPQAESILLRLLQLTPSSVDEGNDLIFATLNSPRGRVMFAIVNYSLRVARLRAKEQVDPRWADSVRGEFTRRLDRSQDDSLEFSASLGEYLIYLYSLDKEWVAQNIDLIFPKHIDKHWQAAFCGYLSHPTVYNEFYDLLRQRNHYEKALVSNIQPNALSERLVYHICFAYLRDAERLDDPGSMIRRLIDTWNVETIKDIVMFFWVQQKHAQPTDMAQALAVWAFIANHYEQKPDLTIEEKKLLAHLARFSPYLGSIDAEALRLLKLTAKYADRNHETPILVEHLARLAEASPHNVAVVFLEMLNNDIYPDFAEQHIKSVVGTIYVAGEQALGNSICNMYLARGYEFLRELFDRNSQ